MTVIKSFVNQTTAGNEFAYKRGSIVPPGGVNLAWVKSPELIPAQTIVMIDTSNVIANNVNTTTNGIYLADELGILQDSNGNQLFQDKFPAISSVFSQEGDLSNVDFNILKSYPFVHKSKYFHIDLAGLTLGSGLTDYNSHYVSVIDTQGNQYTDANGNPKYKIQIAPAFLGGTTPNVTAQTSSSIGNQAAYRVYAFVDTDLNESLYVTYNKIEIDATGNSINEVLSYKEILNPNPLFEYRAEESEVVDVFNREQHWYSSQPIYNIQQNLGIYSQNINGYKIYVPQKALNDPRIFQTFRWRVTCSFDQNFAINQETAFVNVGTIVTNNDNHISTANMWQSLSDSALNNAGVTFVNPLSVANNLTDKTLDNYWYVNLDTVHITDLAKYDVLIWTPTAANFDFGPYMGLIRYFTESLGKRIFIDTQGHVVPQNLGFTTTAGVNPNTGLNNTPGPAGSALVGASYIINCNIPNFGTINSNVGFQGGIIGNQNTIQSGLSTVPTSPLLNAANLHGWNVLSTEAISSLQLNYGANGGFCQYIITTPQLSTTIASASVKSTSFISIGGLTPSSTYNLTTTQYTTNFNSISSAAATGTTGALSVVVPNLPASTNFDRIEAYQNTVFTGTNGASMITSLDGGEFYSVTHNAIVSNGSPASIYAIDEGVHSSTVGTTLHLATASIINGASSNTITSQTLRATLYYYSQTTQTTPMTLTTDNFGTIYTVLPAIQPKPVLAVANNVYLSTLSIPASVAAGVVGAQQILYNLCMIAVSKRSLYTQNDTNYSSSYSFSSPWFASWVIDTTSNPNVLTQAEREKYSFVYLPEDVATPTFVWQRQLSTETLKQLIDNSMTHDQLIATSNANRIYDIEVTNDIILTPTTLADESVPFAWTFAYSPEFTIPSDFPSYVIKEKEVQGDYEAAQYIVRSYPSKPYNFQVSATVNSSYNLNTSGQTTWAAKGTATAAYDISVYHPPTTIQVPVTSTQWRASTQEVELSWAANTNQAIGGPWSVMPYKFGGQPNGIHTWSEWNYYNNAFGPGCLNWPFYGLTGVYQEGSSGIVVQFIQDFMNRYAGFAGFSLPYGRLNIDGYYGGSTAGTVRAFQTHMGARYVDSVIDAETFGLIGAQIIQSGLKSQGAPWQKFYDQVYAQIQLQNISDGNTGSLYGKRSWMSGGPSVTWEIFNVIFDQAYTIHAVVLTPWVQGDSPTMLFEAVDVRNGWKPQNLAFFDSETMMIKHMNMRVSDGARTVIPFAPCVGNAILVGVGQDRTSFAPSSRFLGIRDISALATVTTDVPVTVTNIVDHTIPGYTVTNMQSAQIYISDTGTLSVTSKNPTTFHAKPNYQAIVPPVSTGSESTKMGAVALSNLDWFEVTSSNANITATITTGGLITFATGVAIAALGQSNVVGPTVPGVGQVYYSMDTNRNISKIPQTGWVSKDDGLILLCNANGSPYGIPLLPPVSSDGQAAYSTLNITTYGTDSTVRVGFYDINKGNFIVNANGEPEIAFADYVARGPHNIYIGVISTYEIDIASSLPTNTLDSIGSLPSSNDSPMIPQLSAMPVYGVTTKSATKIGLAPFTQNLGADDVWPVYVNLGEFSQQITIPANVTTNMLPYIGTTVSAFYSIPEAELGIWSTLFGYPNLDIIAEQPTILTDNTLQVSQPPFLMHNFPTIYDSPADPVIPIFTVYYRETLSAPWQQLVPNQIQDYNASAGIIYLQNLAPTTDARLYKVDYTTSQGLYPFKGTANSILNLNPSSPTSNQLLGHNVYIYIVPRYALDQNNYIIPSTVQNTTLRFTLDNTIFNPLLPTYDPLAVQLGILKISPSPNANDITIIDSRRQGGGVIEGVTPEELRDTLQEASNYWDLNYGAGMSYPVAGFVVIRLPVQLKTMYTDSFINNVIRQNLTAGVEYKLQDLNGNDWNLNA